MTPDPSIDVTVPFGGSSLTAIPLDDAVHRVVAFCTNPRSGWSVYDLAAHHERAAGTFLQVSAWSLLWADALAGQVSVRNLADFTHERRARFSQLLSAVPEDMPLQEMTANERSAVVEVCKFGFGGVWGPKITKVAALYRPAAVPVLDGYVAMAFGFHREGFSVGSAPRHERIRQVVEALALWLRENAATVTSLRRAVGERVPEIDLVSDLRLIDIVLWTTQDDRLSRARKRSNFWLESSPGSRIRLEDLAPAPIGSPSAGHDFGA